MACGGDALGPADLPGPGGCVGGVGVRMAGAQAWTIFAVEKRAEETAGDRCDGATRGAGGCAAATFADRRGQWTGVSFGDAASGPRNECAADYGLSSAEGRGESACFSDTGAGGEAVNRDGSGCEWGNEPGDGSGDRDAVGGPNLGSEPPG